MKFEELQRDWESIKIKPISENELRRMMYSSPIGRLRYLTRNEVLELTASCLLLAFFTIWLELFDHLVTAPCGIWWIFVMVDYYFGLRQRFVQKGFTLQETLQEAILYIKRQALISQFANVLSWIALVVVLAMSVNIGNQNILLWALILLPLLAIIIWWSSKKWSKKYDHIKATMDSLGEENKTV